MADPADITQERTEHEENFRRLQIAAMASAGSGLKPKKACYYCSAPLPEPQLFCDEFCEVDHTALERERKNRLGRG